MWSPNCISGLEDNLALVRDALRQFSESHATPPEPRAKLTGMIEAFSAILRKAGSSPVAVAQCLDDLAGKADEMSAVIQVYSHALGTAEGTESDINVWIDALRVTVLSHRRDF